MEVAWDWNLALPVILKKTSMLAILFLEINSKTRIHDVHKHITIPAKEKVASVEAVHKHSTMVGYGNISRSSFSSTQPPMNNG